MHSDNQIKSELIGVNSELAKLIVNYTELIVNSKWRYTRTLGCGRCCVLGDNLPGVQTPRQLVCEVIFQPLDQRSDRVEDLQPHELKGGPRY
jgi:hypothetical protein